ncbi:hypothetical protein EDB83DRAFT_1858276 [Lactarius deliciosus]|nr:hypothetical protein EDB83DRAFT_1858276 [Lactarius deliciosus]
MVLCHRVPWGGPFPQCLSPPSVGKFRSRFDCSGGTDGPKQDASLSPNLPRVHEFLNKFVVSSISSCLRPTLDSTPTSLAFLAALTRGLSKLNTTCSRSRGVPLRSCVSRRGVHGCFRSPLTQQGSCSPPFPFATLSLALACRSSPLIQTCPRPP